MLTMLTKIKGVDISALKLVEGEEFEITLAPEVKAESKPAEKVAVQEATEEDSNGEVTITVKQYMTEKGTPSFDFMTKWNGDKPMPCRIMSGIKVKETRGMVYMKLHALSKPTVTCTCCGRELTNPISRYYGIGPICLEKIGITRDISDVENIKEDLVNITWEGWIIKSAITKEVG